MHSGIKTKQQCPDAPQHMAGGPTAEFVFGSLGAFSHNSVGALRFLGSIIATFAKATKEIISTHGFTGAGLPSVAALVLAVGGKDPAAYGLLFV
jgi:hypothetical protein